MSQNLIFPAKTLAILAKVDILKKKAKTFKKKENKLNPRQARYVAAKLNGHTGRAALKIAGYRSQNFQSRLEKEITKIFPTALIAELDQVGIDEKFLAKKLKALLDKNELIKKIEFKGNKKKLSMIESERPDTFSVKSALEFVFRLRGDFAPEKHEISPRPYSNLSDEELNQKLLEAT